MERRARAPGKPGSPEFIPATPRRPRKVVPPQGVLLSVLHAFQRSQEFLGLAERTRADYIAKIKLIERKFGDFPLSALTDRRTRGVFMAWRDKLATTSRRQADYAWVVLARILSWALNRGLVAANPCEKGGRLYRGSRADKVWTVDDEAMFIAKAPQHLHLPLILPYGPGSGRAICCGCHGRHYDGSPHPAAPIQDRRSRHDPGRRAAEGGARRHAEAQHRHLDQHRQQAVDRGRVPVELAQGVRRRGIIGLTFHDLRGTAVTRLAVAGCTVPEIATITGHSLRDVGAILDSNYLDRDPAMAESAIRKLENGTKSSQLGKDGLWQPGEKLNEIKLAGGLGFEPRLAESKSDNLRRREPPQALCRHQKALFSLLLYRQSPTFTVVATIFGADMVPTWHGWGMLDAGKDHQAGCRWC